MSTEKRQHEQAEGLIGQDGRFWIRAWPLYFLTALFLFNFLSRIVMSPLLPTVRGDLNLNNAEAGALFLSISLGYFVSVSLAGFVSARFNHRRSIEISAIGQGLALMAMSLCQGYWQLNAGLFVMSLFAGLYLPSGIASLTDLTSPNYWGRGLAVHELAPNLGAIAAPLIAEALLGVNGWRAVMLALGLALTCLGLAFSRWGKGGLARGKAPTPSNLLGLMRQPLFWTLMLLFSLAIGAALGIYAMLPLYLVEEHGLSPRTANITVACSRAGGVFAAFGAGWAIDRLGARRTLFWIMLLSGVFTIAMGLSSGVWLWLSIFFQPMVAVCFFPAGFAAIAALGDASTRSMAIGFTVPLGFVAGAGGLPLLIGVVGEHTSMGWGIVGAGVLILSGLAVLPMVPAKAKAKEAVGGL